MPLRDGAQDARITKFINAFSIPGVFENDVPTGTKIEECRG